METQRIEAMWRRDEGGGMKEEGEDDFFDDVFCRG